MDEAGEVVELPQPMFTQAELLGIRELMMLANAPVSNWRAYGLLIQKVERRIQEAQE